MLRNTKELYGTRLAAIDGDIGHVKDFYFDDKNWVVRYMVVDTGTWLTSRLVLLSPHSFGRLDLEAKVLEIKLTRAQIEGSPSIEAHKPVSRQYEIDFYRHYGWPAYWNGGAMWGIGGYPMAEVPSKAEMEDRVHIHQRDDKHLQSVQALTGYGIQVINGPIDSIGSVSGLIVDDRSWAVYDLLVDAGHWYSERSIQITTKQVVRISYDESKVFVTLTPAEIMRATANKTADAESEMPATALFQD